MLGFLVTSYLDTWSMRPKGIDFLNQPGENSRPRIQHRDIKPANLLLQGGSLKVADFGLVRPIRADETGHTGSSTPAFAPPEFLNGTTSRASDQYSLAITYCYLLSGELPFRGPKSLQNQLNGRPDLLLIPGPDRRVVEKALSLDPKDRYESCSDS